MAKTVKVRIEFGAAMASTEAHGSAEETTLFVLVYAILLDGEYRGIFSSKAGQRAGSVLDDTLFELPRPEGYHGPWDTTRFAEGAGSFYRQSFAPTQQLVEESRATRVKIADTLITERWAFEFEAPSS